MYHKYLIIIFKKHVIIADFLFLVLRFKHIFNKIEEKEIALKEEGH
jgi:hypothetical protein